MSIEKRQYIIERGSFIILLGSLYSVAILQQFILSIMLLVLLLLLVFTCEILKRRGKWFKVKDRYYENFSYIILFVYIALFYVARENAYLQHLVVGTYLILQAYSAHKVYMHNFAADKE